MGQRFYSRNASDAEITRPAYMDVDDAAAVYPDHDIVTRHFEGALTIGDFVSALAEGAEGHGGLPTYLRITMRGDATKLRKLMADKISRRQSKQTAH
ncbi:MAG: hypothetical protein QM780_02520 [Hyphomicrobium sp.]|uniref:hypothetical protein n=1 Tax=Hyphomicrobium sp. TaxID=82 RepID=UPI0039E36B8A